MNIHQHFFVRIQKSWGMDGWELILGERTKTGLKIYDLQLTVRPKELGDGESWNYPSFVIRNEMVHMGIFQAIADGMANAGLLSGTSACESELKATKYHLEDMRKLGLK